MEIGIGWSTGNVKLTIHSQTDSIRDGSSYTRDSGASLWFAEINQSFSTTVFISEINRDNMTISGSFEYDGEGAHNYQAYVYKVKGSFKNVVYSYK